MIWVLCGIVGIYLTGFLLIILFGLYWATFSEYGLGGEGKTFKDFWQLMWVSLLWAVSWPFFTYLLILAWWEGD